MKKQSSMNSWIAIAGIIVVAVVVYFIFFSGPSSDSNQSLLEASPGEEEAVSRVLGLLNQIQSLRIDDTFFSGAAYNSLLDYSVAIPPLPVGRENPFAPI